jgi:hypothetical protein
MTVIERSVEIRPYTMTAKVIRCDAFLSLGDLEHKMVEFIEYHNE